MRKRRPVGVWIVLVYQICVALLSIYLVHFAPRWPENAAQKAYHEHLKTFDYVTIRIPALIGWTATILLFSLRKLAVPLLALALGLSLAVMTRLALTSNWLEALGKGRDVVAVAVTIDFAILLYAARLARKGVLY